MCIMGVGILFIEFPITIISFRGGRGGGGGGGGGGLGAFQSVCACFLYDDIMLL